MATTASSPLERKPAFDKYRIARLCLPLLLVVCFCLATDLSQWFQTWQGNRAESANLLAVAMGDARRMFANHFFVKADAYFHSGYYPTIFDNRESVRTPHIAEDSGAMEGKNTGEDELAFLTPSQNWIERFGRELYPTAHSELAAGGANGKEDIGAVREILPWLKLSAQLDPKRTETYTVTAFWLRRMGKFDEAEQFIREGLRGNPGDPQLLFDLGRLYSDQRHDPVRARNLWEAGLRNLETLPDKDKDEHKFIAEQLLAALAKLEEQANRSEQAIALLERLKALSPQPDSIQKWIEDVKAKRSR
jgi:tetratricopeptide (TPR) repeat protein